jgi:hypothetical protein
MNINIIDLHWGQLNPKSSEIENVQKTKIEAKLLETFILQKGLKLFSYNPKDDVLEEVKIDQKGTISINTETFGIISAVETASPRIFINPSCTYFQCLNEKNARRRVERYKNGLRSFESLCNLTKYNPEGIKLF